MLDSNSLYVYDEDGNEKKMTILFTFDSDETGCQYVVFQDPDNDEGEVFASRYDDKGQLIPDALMIDILASVFDSFKDSKGVIFDGFPRTIAQAEALKTMLAERGQEVSIMLDLEVPEDELMTRLIKRGQESGRADDNEEIIKKRLVVYHSQTAPLIDWYKNDGKYCHINGLGTMEGIFADICSAIDKL